jgi:hypothetical protein
MRMKRRLSVYLESSLMMQLNELAERKHEPMSLVAEAAIASFLTPDDSDRREAAIVRRLDRLTRQGERLERDLSVAVEAFALFIRHWLMLAPSLPDTMQAAARAKGQERFAAFMQTLGQRLAGGKRTFDEVAADIQFGAPSAPQQK